MGECLNPCHLGLCTRGKGEGGLTRHRSYVTKDAIGVTDTVSLAVTCVDCYTKGKVTAKLTDEGDHRSEREARIHRCGGLR